MEHRSFPKNGGDKQVVEITERKMLNVASIKKSLKNSKGGITNEK